MAIKKEMPSFYVQLSCDLELCCVCLSSQFSKTLLAVCYRPPGFDCSFVNKLHTALNEITIRFPKANLLLFGDFNFPEINWQLLTSTSRDSKHFLDVCMLFNLSQMIDKPTRDDNILDLVLVSSPDLVQSTIYMPGLSDHRIMNILITLPVLVKSPMSKVIRDFNKADYAGINAKLTIFFDVFLSSFSSRSVEDNWLLFKQKVTDLINLHVPLLRIRGDVGQPWYNKKLKSIDNKKKRLFRKAKASGSPSVWTKYFQCLKEYTALIKTFKKKYFHQDLPNILRTNPTKFWKTITPNPSMQSIELVDKDGVVVPGELAPSVMNDYFSSIFTTEPPDNIPSLPLLPFSQMPPITVTASGISNLIDKLKVSSAPGPDTICSKILKNTRDISCLFLQLIFNQSLSDGCVPTDWKIGRVIPVFKSGDRSLPDNYRPISLTCIASKLLEHIILSNVMNHLTCNNFFFPKPAWFSPGLFLRHPTF